MCFIDASEVFDRVDHKRNKLFAKIVAKIVERGVPACTGRMWAYWYDH